MSVEGPSVDDVAAAIVEFTRATGDGFVLFADEVRELGIAAYPKEVAALAEAVHALYAPVLERLRNNAVQWEACANDHRKQGLKLYADAARYREALKHARPYVAEAAGGTCECEGYYTCNGCEKQIAAAAGEGLEFIDAALVEPPPESKATSPNALQVATNAKPKGQD